MPDKSNGDFILVCLKCGEQERCDEDRCCPTCGRDLFLLAPGEDATLLVEMVEERAQEALLLARGGDENDPLALLFARNQALAKKARRLNSELDIFRKDADMLATRLESAASVERGYQDTIRELAERILHHQERAEKAEQDRDNLLAEERSEEIPNDRDDPEALTPAAMEVLRG